MGLNCRIGDIAAVVRGQPVGALVEVVAKARRADCDWTVRSLSGPLKGEHPVAGKVWRTEDFGCPDNWLRPIRDPGDDAVDETLINNPVRHEVTA